MGGALGTAAEEPAVPDGGAQPQDDAVATRDKAERVRQDFAELLLARPQPACSARDAVEEVQRLSAPPDDAGRARQDFLHFWERYVSPAVTVSRPLMREVLLRATRELGLAALQQGSFQSVDELAARALASAPPSLGFEDAFTIFCTVREGLLHPGTGALLLTPPSGGPGAMTPPLVRRPTAGRLVDTLPPARLPAALGMKEASAQQGLSMPSSPMRESRAALESANAALRAAVYASQSTYNKLVQKAESLRASLARTGAPAGNPSAATVERLAEVHRTLNVRRARAMTLEAELKHYVDRVRYTAGIHEKQQRELTGLQEDRDQCRGRLEVARALLADTLGQLEMAREDNQDLLRKVKTEQLRAMMLREAFEQEQLRVGASLDRAEALFADLSTAAEDTRRAEAEEQAAIRRCTAALTELHTARALDGVAAEARLAELRAELQDARLALSRTERLVQSRLASGGAAAVRATADYAKIEAERHAVSTELAEVRRDSQATAANTRRRGADCAVLRRDLQVLTHRLAAVDKDLLIVAAQGCHQEDGSIVERRNSKVEVDGLSVLALKPRIQLELQAEAALREAAERLEQDLRDLQERPAHELAEAAAEAGREADRLGAASAAAARRHSARLVEELEAVRAELSVPVAAPAPAGTPSVPPSGAALAANLEAAALQRRVGAALAAARENACRLEEERLRCQLLGADAGGAADPQRPPQAGTAAGPLPARGAAETGAEARRWSGASAGPLGLPLPAPPAAGQGLQAAPPSAISSAVAALLARPTGASTSAPTPPATGAGGDRDLLALRLQLQGLRAELGLQAASQGREAGRPGAGSS